MKTRTIYINGKKYKAKPRFFVLSWIGLILAIALLIFFRTMLDDSPKNCGGHIYSYNEWMEEINSRK